MTELGLALTVDWAAVHGPTLPKLTMPTARSAAPRRSSRCFRRKRRWHVVRPRHRRVSETCPQFVTDGDRGVRSGERIRRSHSGGEVRSDRDGRRRRRAAGNAVSGAVRRVVVEGVDCRCRRAGGSVVVDLDDPAELACARRQCRTRGGERLGVEVESSGAGSRGARNTACYAARGRVDVQAGRAAVDSGSRAEQTCRVDATAACVRPGRASRPVAGRVRRRARAARSPLLPSARESSRPLPV